MKKAEEIFWTTLMISFILLVHNGETPLFLIAYSLIPVLILLFHFKRSLWPLAIYLLVFGVLGRYSRYWYRNYASDVLLATHDFIGFLLAGKNPYCQMIFMSKGLIPFCYLPFELLWYLPAQILSIDLRFFEMMISTLVPLEVFLYGFLTKQWQILPFLSVVSLTPFLLDLAVDGSNDNSAIFILLLSIILLVYAIKKKSRKAASLSAIILALALSFKHYAFFYFIFLVPFLWQRKKILPLESKKYLLLVFITVFFLLAPFVLTAPGGFFRSQLNIENKPGFELWGWNLWSGLRKYFLFSDGVMRLMRTIGTLATITVSLIFLKLNRFKKVFIATVLTLFVYLILSKWTTPAYFTFLIPLISLAAIDVI